MGWSSGRWISTQRKSTSSSLSLACEASISSSSQKLTKNRVSKRRGWPIGVIARAKYLKCCKLKPASPRKSMFVSSSNSRAAASANAVAVDLVNFCEVSLSRCDTTSSRRGVFIGSRQSFLSRRPPGNTYRSGMNTCLLDLLPIKTRKFCRSISMIVAASFGRRALGLPCLVMDVFNVVIIA